MDRQNKGKYKSIPYETRNICQECKKDTGSCFEESDGLWLGLFDIQVEYYKCSECGFEWTIFVK